MPTEAQLKAHATLVREIFAPVFFNKLANDFGIVPKTAEEENELLYLAENLPTAKQATAARSPISDAAQGLREVLGQTPAHQQAVKSATAQQIADLAAQGCQVPEIQAAALEWAKVLAQQS